MLAVSLNFVLLPQNLNDMFPCNKEQTELGSGGDVFAIFIEYKGENRCAKCVFQCSDKKCAEAPCSPDERKDGRRGFFRAANAKGSQYTIAEGFKINIK